ncbi:SCO2524 family protein [Actinoplanes sp. NPDC051861]|uniref:SCO2524 family protein n=1 Tax=Actinoplanes sp. NPDC051861 TaxID=3155170 RepID=UPI003436D190
MDGRAILTGVARAFSRGNRTVRLRPRQEMLSVWKSISKWSGSPESFRWEDRAGRNSISDAELLLCLLQPPQRLAEISYDNPDKTEPDVRAALDRFGSPVEIPQSIIKLIAAYLERYTDAESGEPVFAAGRYVSTAPENQIIAFPEQHALEVVDSYATSVVFSLAVIRFLRGYRPRARSDRENESIDAVETGIRKRLTAAMAALLRSFTISVFRSDSRQGRALCETVSPGESYSSALVGRIRARLDEVMAGLSELEPDDDQVEKLRADPQLLFECGWSWGVVRDSQPVSAGETKFDQTGYAEPAPYLYFTVVAVDGIRDLFSRDARLQGLLDTEQQTLARRLNLQLDVAQNYWSTIATFNPDRWPVANLPWRTTDEEETDYYSLLVLSLVRQALGEERAPDADLGRIADLLEDLADRGRIRRRPLSGDPALALHQPGTWIRLVGAETVTPGAPEVGWRLGELATLLLGRSLALARQVNDHKIRAQLLNLSDAVWRHLDDRRIRGGRADGLWDDPSQVFPSLDPRDEPSWYFTTRVVQCMGTAADLIQGAPPPGASLSEIAAELLIEADDVFDEEQLRGSGQGGPALRDSVRRQESNLQRARELRKTRPGTAYALTLEVLRELDKLAAARQPELGE